MKYSTLSAALLGALAASTAPAWADDEAVAWRLFVADQSAPTVTAIDLDHPEQRWTFDVAGPAKLYSTPSKALVVAVQVIANDHAKLVILYFPERL